MLDNPWNAPPRPNADDPGPRIVKPIPDAHLESIFTPRTRRAIEAKLAAAARNVTILPRSPRLLGAAPSPSPDTGARKSGTFISILFATAAIYVLLVGAMVLA